MCFTLAELALASLPTSHQKSIVCELTMIEHNPSALYYIIGVASVTNQCKVHYTCYYINNALLIKENLLRYIMQYYLIT